MSDNITNWKTKHITDLVIPLQEFKKTRKSFIKPNITIYNDYVSIQYCESAISGRLTPDNNYIIIQEFEIHTEGSGNLFDLFQKACEQSTGTMEAVLVWKGGESITRFIVSDTEISNEEIEL